MAEIILAEFGGRTWLVDGDQHMGDLLANRLDPSIAVRFVDCTSPDEAHAMWEARTGGDADTQVPWLINPAIVRRIKGVLDGRSVVFTPWSAMLDGAALDVVAGAAEWLRRHGPSRIVLRQFCPADAPPGLADLQRLRGQLIEAAMARAGAAADALTHETALPAHERDTDRAALVTPDAGAG